MIIDVFTSQNLAPLKDIYYVKIYSMLEINSELSTKLRFYRKSIALYRFIKYSIFLIFYSFAISALYVLVALEVIHRNGF